MYASCTGGLAIELRSNYNWNWKKKIPHFTHEWSAVWHSRPELKRLKTYRSIFVHAHIQIEAHLYVNFSFNFRFNPFCIRCILIILCGRDSHHDDVGGGCSDCYCDNDYNCRAHTHTSDRHGSPWAPVFLSRFCLNCLCTIVLLFVQKHLFSFKRREMKSENAAEK